MGMKRWCGITIWWRRDTIGADVSSWLLVGGGRGGRMSKFLASGESPPSHLLKEGGGGSLQ